MFLFERTLSIDNFSLLGGATASNSSGNLLFTLNSGNAPKDGSLVRITADTMPGGVDTNSAYYVVSSSGAAFNIAQTTGGTPLTYSSSGSNIVIYSGNRDDVILLPSGESDIFTAIPWPYQGYITRLIARRRSISNGGASNYTIYLYNRNLQPTDYSNLGVLSQIISPQTESIDNTIILLGTPYSFMNMDVSPSSGGRYTHCLYLRLTTDANVSETLTWDITIGGVSRSN